MTSQTLAELKARRARLWHPPNAVPDKGIDLSRKAASPPSPPPPAAKPELVIEVIIRSGDRPLTIRAIQEAAAAASGMTADDLISQRRSSSIFLARALAMTLVRGVLHYSMPVIGRHFGDRDHTTILNALASFRRQAAADERIRDRFERTLAILRARGFAVPEHITWEGLS